MTDDAPLPELLMGAARSLRRRWGAVLEPHGLTPHQARALRSVSASDGLRVSDLAAALRIAPRSATEVADGLERADLVVRAADPADRRAVVLRATEQGRELAARVERARAQDAEALFARLDEDDRAELARLLRLVADEGGPGCEGPQSSSSSRGSTA
ncbi:MarR family winged helix-turn-helix transcriptional regulator [uncultured Pseudokineococcus sp.]|uniref:MarR family winged helix-turn-helix transcriptional regulator n=1 Tax=uncultured Pseudokineococcus sp. TaxID=1642928 RepID=UPI002628F132|nr:MarR family transcriptional regulator [uncultured Pseudokineococcus sp.]